MWSNSGSTVSFRARNLPRPVSTKQIKSDYFSFSKRRYRKKKNFFQLRHNIVLDVMQKAYLDYRTCSLNFFTFFYAYALSCHQGAYVDQLLIWWRRAFGTLCTNSSSGTTCLVFKQPLRFLRFAMCYDKCPVKTKKKGVPLWTSSIKIRTRSCNRKEFFRIPIYKTSSS